MQLETPPTRWYSSAEAAKLLHLSVERVRQRVRTPNDPLGGCVRGRTLMVDADRVDAEVAAEEARTAALAGRVEAAAPPARSRQEEETTPVWSTDELRLALANARVAELEHALLEREVATLRERLAAAERTIEHLLDALRASMTERTTDS